MSIAEGICGKTEPDAHSPFCPVCQELGQIVKEATVRSLLKKRETKRVYRNRIFSLPFQAVSHVILYQRRNSLHQV